MLTSAINYGQCVRAGLKNMKKKPRKYSYSVGAAIAAMVTALVAVMVVTLARVEGKKICRKNRLEGTAWPCWPRFYDAIRETFTIALTVPDGRTRFSIIFRGAFY